MTDAEQDVVEKAVAYAAACETTDNLDVSTRFRALLNAVYAVISEREPKP